VPCHRRAGRASALLSETPSPPSTLAPRAAGGACGGGAADDARSQQRAWAAALLGSVPVAVNAEQAASPGQERSPAEFGSRSKAGPRAAFALPSRPAEAGGPAPRDRSDGLGAQSSSPLAPSLPRSFGRPLQRQRSAPEVAVATGPRGCAVSSQAGHRLSFQQVADAGGAASSSRLASRSLSSQLCLALAVLSRDPMPRIASAARAVVALLAGSAKPEFGADAGGAAPAAAAAAAAAAVESPCADLLGYARRRLARSFPLLSASGELLPSGHDWDADTAAAVLASAPVGGGPAQSLAAAAAAAAALPTPQTRTANPGAGGPGAAHFAQVGTLVADMLPEAALAGGGAGAGAAPPVIEQHCTLENASARCSALALHASLPLVVAASAREDISVWDTARRARLLTFANGNPAGSRVSALLLLSDSAFVNAETLAAGPRRSRGSVSRPLPPGPHRAADFRRLVGGLRPHLALVRGGGRAAPPQRVAGVGCAGRGEGRATASESSGGTSHMAW